jgi:hypothetical protein
VEPDDAAALVDAGAAAGHVLGQGEQVAARMELRLVLDPHGAGDRERQGRLYDNDACRPASRAASASERMASRRSRDST